MKTVFIVGAGGSAEAKLPIGSELKVQIARVLNIRDDTFTPSTVDAKISQALSIVVQTGYPYSWRHEITSDCGATNTPCDAAIYFYR